MYINRHIEKELIKRSKTYKCVAITGARQVGKTTLTTHLFPDIKRINMKNPTLLSNSKIDPISFLDGYKTPLFIDEVQQAPFLLDCVKTKLDEIKEDNISYLFSGSQKWNLMKGLSESLAGIVSILELQGLSLREINNIPFYKHFIPSEEYLKEREDKLKEYKDIWEHIHRGSYPELHSNKDKDWETFYSDYIKTYIERDVYQIVNITDYITFYRFLVAMAARTGGILDYNNISNEVGINISTVKNWISILIKTDVIYLLQPYYSSSLSRAIKSPKLYFKDTGLAAYLSSWLTKDTLKNGAANGAFFETFVVNEIIKSYANEGKDYSKYIFYYRGKDKKNINENEIDLIIEEDGTLYPLEIKKTMSPNIHMVKSFNVLNKIKGKKIGNGTLLCLSKDKIKLDKNLYVLPIEYI